MLDDDTHSDTPDPKSPASDPDLPTYVSKSKGAAASPSSKKDTPTSGNHKGLPTGLEAGTVFGGRFEVVSLLGKGGMGAVYRVRDRQVDKREVALKVLRSRYSEDAQFRDLFFREIRTAQGFVSEHVVQVRDCGQLQDGQLFLTTDLVEGESLGDLLKREKALAPRHALEITRQILLGLQSGHEQGFIHRDVKPQNVMLAARVAKTETNPYGVQALLLDFGLSGLAEEMDGEQAAGTPQYMSPEQVNGQRLDPRSDLFAVGVCLYEMVSGRRPFGGKTVAEVTSSVLETDMAPMIERLDGIGKPVKKLLRKALQKEREKRFPSASAFIEAIEKSAAFRAEEGVPRWVALSAGLFFVTTAGAGVFAFDQYTTANTLRDERDRLAASVETLENSKSTDARIDDNEVKRLGEVRDALQRDVERLQGELATSRGEAREFERQRDEYARQLEEKREESTASNLGKLGSDIETLGISAILQRDIDRLLESSIEEDFVKLKSLQTATFFDQVLGDIAANRVTYDYAGLEEARRSARIVTDQAGIGFLDQLIGAARLVASAGRTDRTVGERTEAVERARDEVARLGESARLALFESEASGDPDRSWLNLRRRPVEQIRELIRERATREVLERLKGELLPSDDESVVAAAAATQETEALVRAKVAEIIELPEYRQQLYEWLSDEAAVDERMARLNAALEHLEREVAAREAELGALADAAAARIDLDSPTASRRVIEFVATYGAHAVEHLPRLLGAIADRRTAELVTSDGRLNPEALAAADPTLRELVTSAAAAFDGTTPELVRLARLELARTWYATDEPLEGAWTKIALATSGPGADDESWLGLIRVSIALANPGAPIPLARDDQAEFAVRQRDPATDSIAEDLLRWDLWKCTGVDNGLVSVLQSRLDEKGERPPVGGSEKTDEYRRDPAASWILGPKGATVNLRRIAPNTILGIERWTPEQRWAELFAELSRTSPVFEDYFRTLEDAARMPEGGYACLVVRTGSDTRIWLHPALGIVREDVALVSRSLVHLETASR
jgi:serine/threonine protein kinase